MTGLRITRRRFSNGLAASAVLASSGTALPSVARAQAYPNRPIRFIIPFAAGGVADVTARLTADKLGERLGQRFVIENMPGPGGIAAGRAIATAAPDGYTLGLLTNGTAISVALYKSLPFDPVKAFGAISALGSFDLIFAANAESQFRTLPDFLKVAREQPGKLNMGTIAVGSTQHFGAELLKSQAGIDVQIVPYRTTPEILVALLRNDIALMCDFYAPMKSQLLEGKIRGIGSSGLVRTPFLPDVPPVAEAGVPGYEVASWNAMCAPAGIPSEIVGLLNRHLRDILSTPDVKARYGELGIEAKASTAEEINSRFLADIRKWNELIQRVGIAKL
jgi:tripartite-type tricarboxylate transporter receptor subunit TctC